MSLLAWGKKSISQEVQYVEHVEIHLSKKVEVMFHVFLQKARHFKICSILPVPLSTDADWPVDCYKFQSTKGCSQAW